MKSEARKQQIVQLLSCRSMTSYQIASAVGLTVQYTVVLLERMMSEGVVERVKVPMTGAVGYKYLYYVPISKRVIINGVSAE